MVVGRLSDSHMFDIVDWLIFFILLAAGFLGSLSVVPLNQSILRSTAKDIASEAESRSLRMRRVVTSGVNLAVLTVAVMGGLVLSLHLRIVGSPLLESALRGTAVPSLWAAVAVPIMAGSVLGVVISPLALYRPRESRVDFYRIPIWKRWLAGFFHGGIVEELVFRWFLLAFLVWLLSLVLGFSVGSVPPQAFWAANTLAALIFGLMHLPGSAAAAPLTAWAIFLVIALNIIVGLVYGYFFWHSGLEAAMFAHMSTHLTLQPCASLLLRYYRPVLNE